MENGDGDPLEDIRGTVEAAGGTGRYSGFPADEFIKIKELLSAVRACLLCSSGRIFSSTDGKDVFSLYEYLETPAVAIELDIVERNICTLVENAARHGIVHRPHIKTHRSVELAKLQLRLGAKGITCAKLGEAEVMADAGITDIFVCYPLIGPEKLARLEKLLLRADISTLINSVEGARGLSDLGVSMGRRIPVRIDLDGGLGRGGLQPGSPALEFARAVRELPGIQIVGLMYYGGLIYHQKGRAAMEQIARKEHDDLVQTAALLRADGFTIDVLSGGTSFSGKMPELLEGVTEIRSGHYIFNDCGQLFSGFAAEDDCAMRVVLSVVSIVDEHHAILDAGTKILTSDGCERHPGYGAVLGRPDMVITALNEEHAFLESSLPLDVKIGDKLAVIPNHCCVVCNMVDEVYGIRSGRLDHKIRIDARGKSV